MRKGKQKVEVDSRIEFMRKYPLWKSSMRWAYSNLGAEPFKEYAKKYILIRYENFASAPREMTMRILDSIDERREYTELPFIEEHIVRLGITHTQSGNPSRFSHGDISIQPDNEWKQKLKLGEKVLVTLLTWPLLIRYGYIGATKDNRSLSIQK
jgi:hypothetical protein